MSFPDLGSFLDFLADQNDLVRITAEVDPVLELPEIARQAVSSGCTQALLFERVRGSRLPLVTGLFGTQRRLLSALSIQSLDELTDRVTSVLRPALPSGWLEMVQLIPRLTEVAHWPIQPVATADCQQVVYHGADVDLRMLPAPLEWPGQSAPLLTSGIILVEQPLPSDEMPTAVTASAETVGNDGTAPTTLRKRYVSRVPVSISDRNTVLIHWTPQCPEWAVVAEHVRSGKPLSVAIAFGGDPALLFAAGLPAPEYLDKLVLAGFLRRKGVSVVGARSQDLFVPADAEIILEGLVLPANTFSEPASIPLSTGYFESPATAVKVSITTLTHRASPLMPVLLTEDPRSRGQSGQTEEGWLSLAAEKLLLPIVRLAIPEVTAISLPRSGAFRHLAYVSIRKTFPMQARRAMNALWGLPPLSTVKQIVVVDDDVDVTNEEAVWMAVAAHAHPGRDTLFSEGPADMRDHAPAVRGVGHRIGIDATRKMPEEGHPRGYPPELKSDAATIQLVRQRWTEYGLSR